MSTTQLSITDQLYAYFTNPVVVVQFYRFGYPLIFILGFFGNAASLFTFSRPTLRKVSTGYLFIVLAISDLLYLCICIFDFLEFGAKVNICAAHLINSLLSVTGSILSSCSLRRDVSLSCLRDECHADLISLDLGYCLSRSMDSHTVSVQVGLIVYTEESTDGSGCFAGLGCQSECPHLDTDVRHAHTWLCHRSVWSEFIQQYSLLSILFFGMEYRAGERSTDRPPF